MSSKSGDMTPDPSSQRIPLTQSASAGGARQADSSCEADFAGVTFAFVCIDSGTARAEIFDLLIRLGIPFVDVGMGLVRQNSALDDCAEARECCRNPRQGPGSPDRRPGDEYRANIQIAELNP